MVIATDYASAPATTATVPATKQVQSTTPKPLVPKPAGPHKLFSEKGVTYGDFRDDLARDGYVVVKGAIPRERADKYGEEMMSWLENL
jgi:hypothetical protein